MNNTFMPKGIKGFQKGHSVPIKLRKKISESNMGRVMSKETKFKKRIAMLGKKMPPRTEEYKQRARERLLGKKQSIELVKKRVEARKGYRHSEETINKIRKSNYMENAPTHNKNEYEKKRHLKHLENRAGRNKPEQCEICGSIGRICFDHDHETGRFRGWICHRCNLALGLVKDNIELLEEMIKYLIKNK